MSILHNYTSDNTLLHVADDMARPPFDHQRSFLAIRDKIISHINPKATEICTESCLDLSDLNSVAPDVVVYQNTSPDSTKWIPLLFVEVCLGHQLNEAREKVKKAMLEYSVREAFIYVYPYRYWVKLFFENNIFHDINSSYSHILDMDINPTPDSLINVKRVPIPENW